MWITETMLNKILKEKRPTATPKWLEPHFVHFSFLSLIDSADVSWVETIMSLNLSIILLFHLYAQGGYR